jgi:hypothetical protein
VNAVITPASAAETDGEIASDRVLNQFVNPRLPSSRGIEVL